MLFGLTTNQMVLSTTIDKINVDIIIKMAELVVNGGFEDDFDSWTDVNECEISTDDPYEGTKCLRMFSVDDTNPVLSTIKQEINSLIPGATYTLSFMFRIDFNESNIPINGDILQLIIEMLIPVLINIFLINLGEDTYSIIDPEINLNNWINQTFSHEAINEIENIAFDIDWSVLYESVQNILDSLNISINIPISEIISVSIDSVSLKLAESPCFSSNSIIKTKNIETGEVSNIPVKDVHSSEHLVFNTIKKEFVPIIYNARTGTTRRFMLFEKDVLGENKPIENLYITSGHKMLVNNEIIKAGKVKGRKIHKTKKYERLFTIVTENECPIWINGLDVMTYSKSGFIEYTKKKKIVWIDN